MRRTLLALGVVGGVLILVAIALVLGAGALFAVDRAFFDGGQGMSQADLQEAYLRMQTGYALLQLVQPIGTAAILAGMAILALLSVRFRLRRARAR